MIATEQIKNDIYVNYQPKVFSYIRSRVNDSFLAEDLCSDVFVKVYKKLDDFDESRASVSTWIYTITRNTLTDYYRVRRVNSEIPVTLADDYSFEDEICTDSMLESLADALETLGERERDLIIFHYYKGLTLKEVASKLGISYAYAKLLHGKALSAMRGFLE